MPGGTLTCRSWLHQFQAPHTLAASRTATSQFIAVFSRVSSDDIAVPADAMPARAPTASGASRSAPIFGHRGGGVNRVPRVVCANARRPRQGARTMQSPRRMRRARASVTPPPIMTDSSFPCCAVCGQPVAHPHCGFDRRIEALAVSRGDGQAATTCNILFDEELYVYCSQACWTAHEPRLVAALRLQHPYPGAAFGEPCSRCGEPVDRTDPHVAYHVVQTRVADGGITVGPCQDDRGFALLCRDCEAPEPVSDNDEWAPAFSAAGS